MSGGVDVELFGRQHNVSIFQLQGLFQVVMQVVVIVVVVVVVVVFRESVRWWCTKVRLQGFSRIIRAATRGVSRQGTKMRQCVKSFYRRSILFWK